MSGRPSAVRRGIHGIVCCTSRSRSPLTTNGEKEKGRDQKGFALSRAMLRRLKPAAFSVASLRGAGCAGTCAPKTRPNRAESSDAHLATLVACSGRVMGRPAAHSSKKGMNGAAAEIRQSQP
jgi:hypothetical protein